MLASQHESSLYSPHEKERVEPNLRPIDLYTQYRFLHQPDQLAHFVHLVSATAEMSEYEETMAPVRESCQRYLGQFGVQVSADNFEVARHIFNIRAQHESLPTPESIPVADLSNCWDAIEVRNGVLTVDYSLNGMWEASGDEDAATVLRNFHMYTTGSRDTRHRVFTPVYGSIEEEIKQYGGALKADQMDAESRQQLGTHWDLKNLLTRNPELFWNFHGCAGNINAFDPLFRSWIQSASRNRFRTPFTCIAMEGLGANGTTAEKTYRQIYGIEPDRITIPRYGQQQYEAILASGTAGVKSVRKRYSGHSMGAAGLMFAKDLMLADEDQIRESNSVHRMKVMADTGTATLEGQRLAQHMFELGPHEPLEYFPYSSFCHFNPVYRKGTVMAGTYPEGAPLRTRAQAFATRALVGAGKLAGRTGLDHIPGVSSAVNLGTRFLMGGEGENVGAGTHTHSDSIRQDRAVDMQQAELRAYEGLSPIQLRRSLQDNVPSIIFIGENDRITPPDLQEAAIAAELARLDQLGITYVKPIVLRVPTGHGIPFDDFMRTGSELLATLGDLNVEDRARVAENRGLIQAAINGTVQPELLIEIGRMALLSQEAATSSLIEPSNSAIETGPLYPALMSATPKFMASAHFRAQYVTELLNLMRSRASLKA